VGGRLNGGSMRTYDATLVEKAPDKVLQKEFGFTPEAVAGPIRAGLSR
jgi:hypothetical protein